MIKSGGPIGPRRPLNGQGGFTLLELVISLTIVAVMVVIIFGALRIGIRAWEKGERDLDMRQRQRIVLDLIKRQLASAHAGDSTGSGGQPASFSGDHKSVAFVSHLPLTPGSGFGMVHVRYVVRQAGGDGGESLAFHEQSALVADRKKSAGNPDEGDFSELLSGVKSIVFEYLKDQPGERASRWQKSWDPAVDKGIPRAVRITLEEDDEKAPIYLIAGAGE